MNKYAKTAFSVALGTGVFSTSVHAQTAEPAAETFSINDPRGTVVHAINFHTEDSIIPGKAFGRFQVDADEYKRAFNPSISYAFLIFRDGATQCTTRNDELDFVPVGMKNGRVSMLAGAEVVPGRPDILTSANREIFDALSKTGCVAIPLADTQRPNGNTGPAPAEKKLKL
jgi:hypothetical protein